MRVVIDTNILISAALRDRDPEKVILFVVSSPDIEWIVTPEILKEYKEVLGRPKFGLDDDLKRRWFDLLNGVTTTIESDVTVFLPRDHKDAMFLACAATSSADFFVTGDKDFEHAAKIADVTIVSVAKFKQLVCDQLGPA